MEYFAKLAIVHHLFNLLHLNFSADADDLGRITRIAGLTWDQWNAHLAMPLITQLHEGRSQLRFSNDLNVTSSPIVNSLLKNGQALISRSLTNSNSINCNTDSKDGLMAIDRNGSSDSCSGNNSEQKVDGSALGSPDEGIAEGANGSFGYTCGDCGRVYKLKSSLRNHQKWECGKEPQFQCPLCTYRAKQKMHIIRHMGRMHKGQSLELVDEDFAKMAMHKMDESVLNMGP